MSEEEEVVKPEPKPGDKITIEGYHEQLEFRVAEIVEDVVHAYDTQYNMKVTCNKNQATVVNVKNNTNTDNSGE